ncbi:MAG: o-succinylbenzoate--CoA ligase [Micrococcales bacterium]|nr:o-succinylbenzoate--CoA ligase [Micrococcales bacterium]
MSRPLRGVLPADLADVLPAALDGTGPAVAVGADSGLSVPDEVALVVRTSGSTGEPRDVMLTAAALQASAQASAQRLAGSGTWLLAVPVTSIAGVNVLVRSLLAGTVPVVVHGPFRPQTFAAAAARTDGPSYCSLVPTQLLRLLDDPEATQALGRFSAVLVGGAGLAPQLHARARDAGVNVVTTYGATETCGGAVYDGRPLDGVDVAVVDGRVQVAGPVLAHGYLGRPDLDAQVFVERAGRRWFVTSDLGRWADRLQVLGRADDMIVTGGVNVAPGPVETALVELATVREAVVVGVDDPHWGQAVSAVIVPGCDDPPTLDDLRAHIAARLGPTSAPRRLVVVDALPVLGPGKPDRRAAAGLVATDACQTMSRGDSS